MKLYIFQITSSGFVIYWKLSWIPSYEMLPEAELQPEFHMAQLLISIQNL